MAVVFNLLAILKFLPQYVISTAVALLMLDYMLKHDPSRPRFYLKYRTVKNGFSIFNTRIDLSSVVLDMKIEPYKSRDKFYSNIEKKEYPGPAIDLLPERPITAFNKFDKSDDGFYTLFSILYIISTWFLVFILTTPYRSIASILPGWDSSINYILVIVLALGLLEGSISYIFYIYREKRVLIYVIIGVAVLVNGVTFLPGFGWVNFIHLETRILYQVIISFSASAISYLIYETGGKEKNFEIFKISTGLAYSAFLVLAVYSLIQKIISLGLFH